MAAGEVDGIAGMCTSGGIGDIISRNRNITRGIKVEMGGEEVSVDIYTIVEYGQPIQKVALEVQENVRKAIESMTGLHVVKVDVHVQGVSFEKENQERDAAIEATKAPALEAAKPARKKNAKKEAAPEPAPQPAPAEPAEEAPVPDEPAPAEAPAAEPESPAEEPEAPAAENAPAEEAPAQDEAQPDAEGAPVEDKKEHRSRKPRRRA